MSFVRLGLSRRTSSCDRAQQHCFATCRDPDTILPEKIAGALLTALDNENDGAIAAQIQATLQTLLRAGAAASPSYWLSVCSAVALSAPAAAPRISGGGRQSGAGAPLAVACTMRVDMTMHVAVLPKLSPARAA